MVSKIYAKNFKGQTFENEVTSRTIFVGGVGSGKSSRTMALELLLTGTVTAAGLSKKAGDIFQSLCAPGESKLTVGAVIDGTDYERSLTMTKAGSVRQDFSIDGASVKQANFQAEILSIGIQIADTQAFVSLSDAKKIEHLFELYPPSCDVVALNKEITATSDSLKRAQADAKSKRDMAAQLKKDRSEMNLPDMTPSEVMAEIEATEKQIEAVREDISTANKQAWEAEQAAKNEELKAMNETFFQQATEVMVPESTEQRNARGQRDSPLKKVFDVLMAQECGATCPAMMVCKREMRNA